MWVLLEGGAVRDPDVVPGVVDGGGPAGHDAGAGDSRSSAEISAEFVAGGRWESVQGRFCG